MKRLRHQDWLNLVSAIDELYSDFDARTLPRRALSAVAKVIAADSVTFTGFDNGGEYAGLLWDTGKISPEDMKNFARYMYENPLVGAYVIERRPETLTVTDLIAREEYRRTTVYNEFYRRIGVESQLVTPLPISDELFMSCSVNTGRSDFSARDKLILTLFAPSLVKAIRNAFAYQRLASALETEACGVISINSKGKPIFISEFAQQLFKGYFAGEKCERDSLPKSLSGWLKQVKAVAETAECRLPPEPLKIETQQGVLTIRWMYNSVTREEILLLEEKRLLDAKAFEKLNLTKREAEVLFWISRGKTYDAIATLCDISMRTVHKHVEHIYVKLGVETRTAAMLKALEIE